MNFLLLLSILVAVFAVAFTEEIENEDIVQLEEDNALFKAIESEYPFHTPKKESLPALRQAVDEKESELSKAVSLEAHMKISAIDNTEDQDHVYIVLDSVEEESINSLSPTEVPSAVPTTLTPSATPTTITPSAAPTTITPSRIPSLTPTVTPTRTPTENPTRTPTHSPTANPTFTPGSPTPRPTAAPSTAAPTMASILKFNSTLTLGGINVTLATDKDKEAIKQTTALSMGIDVSTVRLTALVQVTASTRRSLTTSSDLLAEAILQIIQQVTGGADPTALYQTLTTQLTKAVTSNNFTAVLQTVSKSLGANATATAQVTKLVNTAPVIDYSPQQAPTYSPTNGPDSNDDNALNGGEIAGIVIGATFGFVLLIGLFLWMKANSAAKATLVVHPSPANNAGMALVEV